MALLLGKEPRMFTKNVIETLRIRFGAKTQRIDTALPL